MSNWSQKFHRGPPPRVAFFWQEQSLGFLDPSFVRFWKFDPIEEAGSRTTALLLFEEKSVRCAYLWALESLGRSNRSKAQLAEKIKRKGLAPSLVDRVSSRLEKAGFLDEEALVDGVRRVAERKNRSLRWTEQKLSSKGLALEERKGSLEEALVEQKRALYWLNRWQERGEDLQKRPLLYKARLASRGFSSETIAQAWLLYSKSSLGGSLGGSLGESDWDSPSF